MWPEFQQHKAPPTTDPWTFVIGIAAIVFVAADRDRFALWVTA
jgi:hypothetical protein